MPELRFQADIGLRYLLVERRRLKCFQVLVVDGKHTRSGSACSSAFLPHLDFASALWQKGLPTSQHTSHSEICCQRMTDKSRRHGYSLPLLFSALIWPVIALSFVDATVYTISIPTISQQSGTPYKKTITLGQPPMLLVITGVPKTRALV